MKKIINLFVLALTLQSVASCAYLDKLMAPKTAAVPQIDYLNTTSKLNLKTFLNGNIDSYAVTFDENGKIQSTYTAKINGTWDENRGTVRFNYVYNNGKKENRTWLVTFNENGEYSAIGHDFVGEATGKQLGNASLINYNLMIPLKDKKQQVEFEDRIYQIDENSAIMTSVAKQGKTTISNSIVSLKKNNQ